MDKPEKIAAIVAITQIFRYYGVPTKYLPVLAIMVGVALEYGKNPTPQAVLDGVVLGALTTGSFGILKDSAETVLKAAKKKDVKPLIPARNPVLLEPDDDRGV